MALLGVALLWAADEHYQWRSNLVLLATRDSKQPLLVQTKRGWKKVTDVSLAELDGAGRNLFSQDGLKLIELSVRREAQTGLEKLAQWLCPARVNVLQISPTQFDFTTSFKPGFVLTTAKERLESEGATLAITANFRDPAGKPLGWVIRNGQQVNRPFPAWTGVFFVKNGRPYFGPKSLVDEVSGTITEGAQGYPSVMKNHTVFSYVDLAPDKYFDGRRIAYRALAGTRKDGTVLMVLSGLGGVMNVSEVTALADKLQVQHATLLDGGKALQYSLNLGGQGREIHFRAYNTLLDIGPKWMAAQRSPVYIVVKKKADPK